MRREIPPTAGLPVRLSALFSRPRQSLHTCLQEWLHIPSPIFTCSGTAALVVALKALQQQKPHCTHIIVPAYTCPLVALAAHYCSNLRVIACDLLPDSIDMDPVQLDRLCNVSTLAIVVTHLGGRVTDLDTAVRIAHKTQTFIIEDCAQAMGAFFAGKSVGLHGDIGFFSMAAGKGLTTYEGGILFSRDPALHQALDNMARSLLPEKWKWRCRRTIQLWAYSLFYRPQGLWYVYGRQRNKALQRRDFIAAVGDDFSASDIPLHNLDAYRQRIAAASFPDLLPYLAQGKIRARQYIARLQQIQGVHIITDPAGAEGIWPFIMVLLPSQQIRDDILAHLWTEGVGVTRLFIHALPDYPQVRPQLPDIPPYPVARDIAARMLTITNSHWLDDTIFRLIAAQIQKSLDKSRLKQGKHVPVK